MEPASIDSPKTGTPRTGSLENPEVVENVPGPRDPDPRARV